MIEIQLLPSNHHTPPPNPPPNQPRPPNPPQVYYNNLLSIPPILCLMFFFGEHKDLMQQPALQNPVFLCVAFVGGLIGFGISFSALWFLSQTTVRGVVVGGRGGGGGIGCSACGACFFLGATLISPPIFLDQHPSPRWSTSNRT